MQTNPNALRAAQTWCHYNQGPQKLDEIRSFSPSLVPKRRPNEDEVTHLAKCVENLQRYLNGLTPQTP